MGVRDAGQHGEAVTGEPFNSKTVVPASQRVDGHGGTLRVGETPSLGAGWQTTAPVCRLYHIRTTFRTTDGSKTLEK